MWIEWVILLIFLTSSITTNNIISNFQGSPHGQVVWTIVLSIHDLIAPHCLRTLHHLDRLPPTPSSLLSCGRDLFWVARFLWVIRRNALFRVPLNFFSAEVVEIGTESNLFVGLVEVGDGNRYLWEEELMSWFVWKGNISMNFEITSLEKEYEIISTCLYIQNRKSNIS